MENASIIASHDNDDFWQVTLECTDGFLMRKTCDGFSIIEFSIYFLVMQVCLMVMIHWTALQTLHMKKDHASCLKIVALYAAHDRIVQDIRMTQASDIDWGKARMSFVWPINQKSVGWEIKEGKLFRSEGLYDLGNEIWIRRKKNLVAQNVKKLNFKPTYDTSGKQIIGMTIELQADIDKKPFAVKRSVCLYNGIVV